MDAFGSGHAAQVASDIGIMAPGVSAALSTTVAGLLVAILHVRIQLDWSILRVNTVELDNFAQTLASRMETEFPKDE